MCKDHPASFDTPIPGGFSSYIKQGLGHKNKPTYGQSPVCLAKNPFICYILYIVQTLQWIFLHCESL